MCETHRQLAALFTEVSLDYDRPGPPRERPGKQNLPGRSLEALFSEVNESNCTSFWRVLPEKVSIDHEDYLLQQLSSEDPCRMVLAFRGLGALGTTKAFQAVRSYIENSEDADGRVRRRAFQAMAEMPGSLSLDTARRWFQRKEWYLQVAAGDILENHATSEDIPLLIGALRTPETIRCEDFRLSSALNAFTLFEGIGPVAELKEVFRRVGSCYDRYRAAVAMDTTAPVHFAAEYAFECLWDCHWDTRALGCETVSLSTPGALEQLRELAAGPHEHPTVREKAAKRLEGF